MKNPFSTPENNSTPTEANAQGENRLTVSQAMVLSVFLHSDERSSTRAAIPPIHTDAADKWRKSIAMPTAFSSMTAACPANAFAKSEAKKSNSGAVQYANDRNVFFFSSGIIDRASRINKLIWIIQTYPPAVFRSVSFT